MSPKKVPIPPKTQESLIHDAKFVNSGNPETYEYESKKIITEGGKLYQDQIYGAKVLTPLAVEIIDTPEFQRLGGIKQLGFANVAYRGAENTRLAHSIGTYFVTRTIMRRIVQNHERFGFEFFEHPGKHLSEDFRLIPRNAYDGEPPDKISHQSKWRGLTEVVSIAALLHDITHVPFGHTLEDEFDNIYLKHDKLAGPRLFKFLFDEKSCLKKVFDAKDNWIQSISNDDLKKLIYVILSWKDRVDVKKFTGISFEYLLKTELKNCNVGDPRNQRLKDLMDWHNQFVKKKMFHPFMSDVIANTICADLLDYLPRDRMNLGMEYQQHNRIQRFLTIGQGTLYPPNEGLRLSILVTRSRKGGQRPDVATAVLKIMRERYEMSERVYHHHKKAAASSMLVKLVEICGKPRDDENVYPAPWTSEEHEANPEPHILHFSDSSLIDYLGNKPITKELRWLQRKLYLGLKYKRKDIYRTLLVLDTDLIVKDSPHTVGHISTELRSERKRDIERQLSSAANATYGEVLIYCPDSDMQSKEVHARLQLIVGQILPLSAQQKVFAYNEDVRVLQQYYKELWRSYIFVSKEIFNDKAKCQTIIDTFCRIYKIRETAAYQKVREYKLDSDEDIVVRFMEPITQFLYNPDNGGLPFNDTPTPIISSFMRKILKRYDEIRAQKDPHGTLSSLFIVAALENHIDGIGDRVQKENLKKYIKEVSEGRRTFPLQRAGEPYKTFNEFNQRLLIDALGLEQDIP